MQTLAGKVVVITGASSGIGEATAETMAQKGAKVVLTARREENLRDIVNKINAQGGQATYRQADVTSRQQVQEVANFAIEQYGKIDVWINNAGIMPLSFLNKLKVDEWDKMIDVNIKGVLYGIAAVLSQMEKQQSGHIINVSSVAGHMVGVTGTVYSATKHAVRAISEGLRQELSPRSNIRSTIISPGSVETELRTSITDEDVINAMSKRTTIPIQSTDIANAIVYAVEQPEQVSVNEILIRPTAQKR